MDRFQRSGYSAVALLAAALVCALALAAGASPQDARAGRALSADEPASVPGTPTAPVSVTCDRSFTVTGTAPAGPADELAVVCYRLVAGEWVRERSLPATITALADGAEFSATVVFDVAGTWVLRAETTAAPPAEPSVSATSAPIRVSSRADAIVWNRDGVTTLPERMAYRSDARQLIISTAKSLASHSGTTTVYEYRSGDWVELFSSPSRFGRNGLCSGTVRRRGNGKTPTGIWLMPSYVFGQRAVRPSDTKMPYRHITKYTWWSSEKGSHYNSWVWSRRRVDGEHLIDYTKAYEYALSTGYNAKPNSSVYGRGAGIFLHVWGGPTTAGCVAVPLATMQRVFRTLDPAKRRVFVVGTLGQSDPTRVELY
jgi:L,D-peptidoglycan transpeptidase YkuD (ErfK/YbiS/YcfS/YnhG family)